MFADVIELSKSKSLRPYFNQGIEGNIQHMAYRHWKAGGTKINFLTNPDQYPDPKDWEFEYKGKKYDYLDLAQTQNDPNFKNVWKAFDNAKQYEEFMITDPKILNDLGFKKPTTLKYELILGEVKTDVSYLNQAINQLTKYSKVELANRLYTIIPNCKNNNNNYFGEGFISKEKFFINESINKINVNKDNQKVDEDWLNNSIKLNLLGNLPFEELKRLIKKRHKMNKDSKIYSSHLLNYAVNSSVEEIMETIINYHGIH